MLPNAPDPMSTTPAAAKRIEQKPFHDDRPRLKNRTFLSPCFRLTALVRSRMPPISGDHFMQRLLLILAICSAVAFAPVPARKTHRILYAGDRSGNFEIISVDADGKNERNLTKNDAKDTSPSWSPDGKKIAF